MESCILARRMARSPEKMCAQLLLKTLAFLWATTTVGQQATQVLGLPYGSGQPANPTGSAMGSIPRLPNVNIYIKKQEVKKLLGIEARIDYVTNGNINLYPFRFTIPLGYNQSDLIFTWQNLGQTNVNYSISLAIGNLKAVETPLINITRTGLIPKQEQVFKITLPCSGRITDEVDVQVLIDISGYVALDEDWINDEGTHSTPPNATADQLMQSDQVATPALRLVQHKLAIRRKKICTAHPTPVSARPPLSASTIAVMQRPAHSALDDAGEPELDPPEQPVAGLTPVSGSDAGAAQPPPPPTPMDANEQTTAKTTSDQWHSPLATSYLEAVRAGEGAHPSVANPALFGAPANWQAVYQPPPRPQATPFNDSPPPPYRTSASLRPSSPVIGKQQQVSQQQQVSNSALMLTLLALSLLASLALALVALLGSSWRSARTPLDKLSALTGGILRRASPAAQVNKYKSPMSGSVIGSLRSGGPKSSMGSSVPGLGVSISGKQLSNSNHSGPLSNAGYCFKSTCGPPAGYYTTGRQPTHYHYQPAPTGDLLGTEFQCQQQQQGSAPLPPPPPQYPIYHIPTGINPSQTTRLIWNTGNGSSPDGFLVEGAYMPLSNAARSDNGSVYQTIY